MARVALLAPSGAPVGARGKKDTLRSLRTLPHQGLLVEREVNMKKALITVIIRRIPKRSMNARSSSAVVNNKNNILGATNIMYDKHNYWL